MKSLHTKASTFANRTSRHSNQSLQKSLLFATADKIVFKKFSTLQKNKNATHNQRSMTQKLNIDNGLQGRPIRTTGYNKVLPKAGLNGFDWTFAKGSTFVLRLNFSAKNPRLRQYPNRYLQA